MTDKQKRLIDMQEVWYIDLQHNMDEIAADGVEIPRTSILRLKRIVREIEEELEEYGK